MSVVHVNSISGITSITAPSSSDVLTLHSSNTSEKVRITSGGVTQITKGTSGGATANTDAALIVDNSSHTYVQFRTPDNKEQGLLFGDDADNDAGAITYSHSTNHLGFRVNADERLRITSTGKVGINQITPTADLEVAPVGTACTSTVFINAPTHNTNVASEAALKFGYKHSGGQAVGYIKLNEGGGNSFDGNLTIGVPYNKGSGNFGTRDAVTIRYNGAIGFNTSTPYAYDTTATTLEVKGSVASAADTEVVRFRGGSDANGGTAVLRLTNDNDRGLVVKGGREYDAEFAEFGTSTYSGTYNRGIRINSSGKVGIGTTNIDRDLEVFNSGSQTAIGIKGGTNTAQCSLWFTKPTDSNIGGIYYLHGSDDNQGFHFRANDNQVANIKGSGILTVENTITGAGHTAGVYIFKASGSDDDHAELAVGYDRLNCYVIKRKRNSGTIEINATQSGANVQHEYQGATRWMEYGSGLISTYTAGGANILGAWQYTQVNQSQNYEHHILGPDGTLLFPTYVDTNAHGEVWVGVTGTGTNNAYTHYRFSNKSNHANLQLTHIAGGSSAASNIPYIVNNSNNPAWKMDHSGTYTLVIHVIVFGGRGSSYLYTTDNVRGANP